MLKDNQCSESSGSDKTRLGVICKSGTLSYNKRRRVVESFLAGICDLKAYQQRVWGY